MIIIFILIVYLMLGAMMDSHSVLFITIPIVVPLVIGSMGYDLVWWGIVMLMVLETGLITPPFGIHVFVLKGIAGEHVPLGTVFRGVTALRRRRPDQAGAGRRLPQLALWLPSTMIH